MNEDRLLEIRDLSIAVRHNNENIPIVKGIDMSIPRGSIVGLVGESGCGKSMTARAVNNTLPPTAKITGGNIFWYEHSGRATDLVTLGEKDMRRRCGTDISMVFQEPMTSLNPMMRVGDQIVEVLKIHGLEKNRSRAKERAIKNELMKNR